MCLESCFEPGGGFAEAGEGHVSFFDVDEDTGRVALLSTAKLQVSPNTEWQVALQFRIAGGPRVKGYLIHEELRLVTFKRDKS